MILLLCLLINLIFAHFMWIGFGWYDWSVYKKGKPIFRHQKVLRFIIRFLTAVLISWLAPGPTLKNFFVIGTTFWFFFDAYIGFKINRDIYYTGTESFLDDLGASSLWYYWGKFFLMFSSYIIYFL